MKKLCGLMVLGLLCCTPARADSISLGTGLFVDQLPVGVNYELSTGPNLSVDLGISGVGQVTLGPRYFWDSNAGGWYSGARGGINLFGPIFSATVQQGYRFSFNTQVFLDAEVGLQGAWGVGLGGGVIPGFALRLGLPL